MKNNKYLLMVFILLSLPIIFIGTIFYQQSKQQKTRIKADALDVIDQRMKNTYTEINNFPSGAADNLLFLSKLPDFQKIIGNPNATTDIKKDFLEFLKQTDAYYQISYVNKNGIEIVKAEFDGQVRKIITNLNGKYENDISYFNLLKSLKDGEIYIFPLEMELNPKKISILKYATPIFDQKTHKFEGIISVKVYADYFLESIRRSQREGESTYLIDTNGFYLANPDKEKEFSYLFDDKKDNFFSDYPSVEKDMMVKCKNRRQETSEKIFTYRCISPTITNFETYEGYKTIDGKLGNIYQWLLVTVTNKDDGLKDFSKQKFDFWWIVFIQISLQGIIFILFLFNNKLYEKDN